MSISSIGDVRYCLRERPDTDFSRLMTTYRAVKEIASGIEAENGRIGVAPSMTKFTEASGLSMKVARQSLESLEALGVVELEENKNIKRNNHNTKVYFIPNREKIKSLDRYLKKAKELGLLT